MIRQLPSLVVFLLAFCGCSNAFVEWETRAGGKSRALRPLAHYIHADDPPESRAVFLWPLGSYRADLETATFRFFPFYMRHSRARAEGPDWDSVTGLLLFRGADPERGAYTGLFPIGGTFKNLFLKERIDFLLFPLFARVREGESTSTNILWPIANRATGAVSGWKIWPLYGRYQKTDPAGTLLYDRRFWLWPFFTDHRNHLADETPSRLFFFFPFYGSHDGERISERTWLWPFFKRRVERGERPREDWRVPFPFVQIGDGTGYRRRDFWPLYGDLALEGWRRRYWLWPLFRSETRAAPPEDASTATWEGETRRFLLPFHWRIRQTDAEGRETLSRFKIWPLYGSRREKDGSTLMEILSPLWFTDPDGVEALLGPFWRLVARATSPDGQTHLSLGFRLLYDSRRRPGAPADWTALGGLVGRQTVDGRRRTRFLFILW